MLLRTVPAALARALPPGVDKLQIESIVAQAKSVIECVWAGQAIETGGVSSAQLRKHARHLTPAVTPSRPPRSALTPEELQQPRTLSRNAAAATRIFEQTGCNPRSVRPPHLLRASLLRLRLPRSTAVTVPPAQLTLGLLAHRYLLATCVRVKSMRQDGSSNDEICEHLESMFSSGGAPLFTSAAPRCCLLRLSSPHALPHLTPLSPFSTQRAQSPSSRRCAALWAALRLAGASRTRAP